MTSGASKAASEAAVTSARSGTERHAAAVREDGGAPDSSGDTASAVAAAVVLATAPASDGGPAAALPWDDTTVLRRLLGQLRDLDVRSVHVVTRHGWDHVLRPSLADLGPSVRVHVSPTVADDLRTIAEVARDGSGPIVVAHGDIVTHREALAGLLADPRVVTGILTRHGGFPPFLAPRTRSTRARVVSASSPYHATARPNTSLLGVLKVGARDRAALVAIGERLATLTEPPLPAAWEEELERKAERWRFSLAHNGEGDGPAGVTRRPVPGEPVEPAPEQQAIEPEDAAELEDGAEPIVLSPEDEAEVGRRLAVMREDAVSLLLVGFVRDSAHITNSYLRSLFWARPLSRAAAAEMAGEIKGYDEDRVLLDSAVKGNDGFFTTFFVSPYSKYIARWAARRGLTPNQVTTASMAIGVLAAAAFATGSRPGLVAGAVLLQAAFTADCVDGQLARYTRTFSKLGAWLDSIFDRAKEYVVFAGLAIGATRGFGDDVWVLAVAALALQTVRHMFDFSYAATQHDSIATARRPPVEESRDRVGLQSAPAVLRTSPSGGDVERADGTSHAAVSAPTAPAASPLRAADPVAEATPAPPSPLPRRIARGVARRAFGLSRALDRWRWTRWVKKMLVFPIGERFALLAILAAVATPRITFVALLVCGAVAALYQLAGRLLRSFAA